ncbi:MAG TPA: CHAD domain-containing protein [Ilumatobacteraceae bacterium]|nr:CHAD domain-containing protein [Ilumatobacteraceae bacterium]
MSGAAVTFTSRERDPADAISALAGLGFVAEPSHTVTRTLLDSFDGRLHAAGLRLELNEGAGLDLILSGLDVVPARVRVDSVPRSAADLAPGPFRTRLAAVLDVRALFAVLRVTSTQTRATLRDRAAKTVATASVHDDVRVLDRDGVAGVPRWIVEVDEIEGYAKPARQARDVLGEQLGLERVDGDVLTIAAAGAGVDLAGFSSSPTVPLDPAMPAIDGFRAVLANLADTIVANWQGTIDRVDPEFLHDLRVAVRRTRTIVTQGKRVLPPAVVEQAGERFAALGSLTGPVRDLDVYLIEWQSYTEPLGADAMAALEPVRAVLARRRDEAHAALVAAMRSDAAAELMAAWRAWLNDPAGDEVPNVHADRALGKVVAKRIARVHATLVEDGRRIGPDTAAAEIHDLRKDAKKLRYLLECFASLLPKAPRKAFVRPLKALQDNLGEHQDAEVHIATLRAIAGELHDLGASSDTMLAIGQLSERLDQRRLAARAEFDRRFANYDTKSTRRAMRTALDALEE